MFENIREQFDIYKNHPDLVYLDSSATALKPRCVLDKVNSYYNEYGVNVHRGVYELSYIASSEYEKAREKVSEFINCDFSEVVFKRNASEALNFVALTYGEKYIKEGDVVLTTELEHHSSVLPWMKLCERKKAKLEYIKLNEIGRITLEEVKKALNEKVKVLAITYVSNVLGYKTIMWTRDTIDWRDHNSSLIYNRAVTNMCGGDLILMHPTENTVEALTNIILYAKKHNFVLSTVSETLAL